VKSQHFRTLFAMVRAHWFATVLCCLIGALGAGALSMAIPVRYEASARLFVATPNWNDNTASGHPDPNGRVQTFAFGDEFSQHRAITYAQLANTERVAAAVIARLGLQTTPHELAGRISARVVPDTVMLDVQATDPSPDQAARIANAAAEELTKVIFELETPFKLTTSPVVPLIIKRAVPPTGPAAPRLDLNVIAGLVLGLLVGVTYAAARQSMQTANFPEELVTSETTLGVLHSPEVPTFATVDDLPHELAEDVRFLCLRLSSVMEHAGADDTGRTILFASPRAGSAAGTAAVLVAAGFAELDHRVAIVMTNFASAASSASEQGLGEVLDGRVSLKTVLRYDDSGRVGVIVAGSTETPSVAALTGAAMAAVVEQLESAFDYVIFTGSALLESTDSLALAGKSHAAVVICPVPPSTAAETAESERLLGLTPTAVLGRVVMSSRKREVKDSNDIGAQLVRGSSQA
jgi:succinoglycan biosynthesis transport protein ExoP